MLKCSNVIRMTLIFCDIIFDTQFLISLTYFKFFLKKILIDLHYKI